MEEQLFGKTEAVDLLSRFTRSDAVHVCVVAGEPECGKTLLVRKVLPAAHYIDVRECASLAVLLRRLSKVFDYQISSLVDLIKVSIKSTKMIIFDHVDYFEQNLEDGHRILSIMARLPERLPGIKTVFVGRNPTILLELRPLVVQVRSLSKSEIIDCTIGKLHHSEGLETLCPLVYSVSIANGAVFPESFTMTVAQLYPLFMRPVREGRRQLSDSVNLFKELRPKMIEIVGRGSLLSEPLMIQVDLVERCLLIAAHLCRVNSVKHELVVFGEEGAKRKRKLGLTLPVSASKVQTSLKTRAICIQRILAVFHHIYPHSPPVMAVVLSSMRSLFERKLLLPMGLYERSDNFRVRCNVSVAEASGLGAGIGMDISNYVL